jgi:hypothetical protein
MDLKQLVAKPQLKMVKLDDSETVKEYGEALEFYVYDRQPVDVFVKMASLRSEDFGDIVKIVNSLILDKDGNPVVTEGMALPQKLYMRVIEKVVFVLGE